MPSLPAAPQTPVTSRHISSLHTVLLANPRGFCAGVDRAIEIVEEALHRFGAPIYVKHAIVHNRHVVDRLEQKGAIFVEEVCEAPVGARMVFSAHGVSPQVHQAARARQITVVDATCPLVTKVHMEARLYAKADCTIFLVGHANHVEVIGAYGEAPEHIVVVGTVEEARTVQAKDSRKVAYLTQTTLSMDDTQEILAVLKKRFPALQGPRKEDICYATQNRQNAVRRLAKQADVILVVGSAHSSNSTRLVEVGEACNTPAYLVESRHNVELEWLKGAKVVGVTAGASAPEDVVQDLVRWLAGAAHVLVKQLDGPKENVRFPMPKALFANVGTQTP